MKSRAQALRERALHPHTPPEEARNAAIAYLKLGANELRAKDEEIRRLKLKLKLACNPARSWKWTVRILKHLDDGSLSYDRVLHCFRANERALVRVLLDDLASQGIVVRDGQRWSRAS